MFRIIVFVAVASAAHMALAQYYPPPYPMYAGAGTTAAGSSMTGMANAISAKGNYNLSTSQAAINLTQAQSNEIQNHAQATSTYYEMQEMNQKYLAEQRGPKPTTEQIARMAREGAPKAITNDQVDPISGRVEWPTVLQDDRYASDRVEVDRLLAKQATYGALGINDQTKARQTIDAMFKTMKGQIRDLPPQQYTSSRSFLESLMYSMTKARMG